MEASNGFKQLQRLSTPNLELNVADDEKHDDVHERIAEGYLPTGMPGTLWSHF